LLSSYQTLGEISGQQDIGFASSARLVLGTSSCGWTRYKNDESLSLLELLKKSGKTKRKPVNNLML